MDTPGVVFCCLSFVSRLDISCSILRLHPWSRRGMVPLLFVESSAQLLSVCQSPLRWFGPSSAFWADGCRSEALSGPPRLRRSPAVPHSRKQSSFLNPVLFCSRLSQNMYVMEIPHRDSSLLPSFAFVPFWTFVWTRLCSWPYSWKTGLCPWLSALLASSVSVSLCSCPCSGLFLCPPSSRWNRGRFSPWARASLASGGGQSRGPGSQSPDLEEGMSCVYTEVMPQTWNTEREVTSPLTLKMRLHSCFAYAWTYETKALMLLSNMARSARDMAFTLGSTSTTSLIGGIFWRGHWRKHNINNTASQSSLQISKY